MGLYFKDKEAYQIYKGLSKIKRFFTHIGVWEARIGLLEKHLLNEIGMGGFKILLLIGIEAACMKLGGVTLNDSADTTLELTLRTICLISGLMLWMVLALLLNRYDLASEFGATMKVHTKEKTLYVMFNYQVYRSAIEDKTYIRYYRDEEEQLSIDIETFDEQKGIKGGLFGALVMTEEPYKEEPRPHKLDKDLGLWQWKRWW